MPCGSFSAMSTERLWRSPGLLVRVRATKRTERKTRNGRVREGCSSSSRRLRRMDTTVEMRRQLDLVKKREERGRCGERARCEGWKEKPGIVLQRREEAGRQAQRANGHISGRGAGGRAWRERTPSQC